MYVCRRWLTLRTNREALRLDSIAMSLFIAISAGCGIDGSGLSQGERTPTVWGGTPTDAYPAVGMLSASGYQCTASLIKPRVILTAAHCEIDGTVTLNGETYTVIDHERNDEYTPGFAPGDLAVALLDRDVPLAPLILSRGRVGEAISIVGIGDTDTTPLGGNLSGIKHIGYNKIDEIADGILWYTGGLATWFNPDTNQEEPFNPDPDNNHGGCPGDSGGPNLRRGTQEIVGVESHGACAEMALNVDVGAYKGWILDNAAWLESRFSAPMASSDPVLANEMARSKEGHRTVSVIVGRRLIADFDGDDCDDTLEWEAGDPERIKIRHGCNGGTASYNMGGMRVQYLRPYEGNGRPGSEVLIYTRTGVAVLSDLDDRLTRESPVTGSWRLTIGDVDGQPGEEIVLAQQGKLQLLNYGRDKLSTWNYPDVPAGQVVVVGIEELDGQPGGEIIMRTVRGLQLLGAGGPLGEATVNAARFSVNGFGELDGQPGQEMVLATNTGIVVISAARGLGDQSKSVRAYPMSGDYMIHDYLDTDGKAGAEVVVLKGDGVDLLRQRSGTLTHYDLNAPFRVVRGGLPRGNGPHPLTVGHNGGQKTLIDGLGWVTSNALVARLTIDGSESFRFDAFNADEMAVDGGMCYTRFNDEDWGAGPHRSWGMRFADLAGVRGNWFRVRFRTGADSPLGKKVAACDIYIPAVGEDGAAGNCQGPDNPCRCKLLDESEWGTQHCPASRQDGPPFVTPRPSCSLKVEPVGVRDQRRITWQARGADTCSWDLHDPDQQRNDLPIGCGKASTVWKNMKTGKHTVRFRGTGPGGTCDTQQVSFSVAPPPQPPACSLKVEGVGVRNRRKVTWGASRASQCRWDLYRPTGVKKRMPIGCRTQSTVWKGLEPGNYTVRFWASGPGGTCPARKVNFTVKPPPPVCSLGVRGVGVRDQRRVDWGSKRATKCRWDLYSPGKTQRNMPIGCKSQHTVWKNLKPGKYTVKFRAYGPGGSCAAKDVKFTVLPKRPYCYLKIEGNGVRNQRKVTWAASRARACNWDLYRPSRSPQKKMPIGCSRKTTTWKNLEPGNYTVNFRASGPGGSCPTRTVKFSVKPPPPSCTLYTQGTSVWNQRKVTWGATYATQCRWDLHRPGSQQNNMSIGCKKQSTTWTGLEPGRFTVRFRASGPGGSCSQRTASFGIPPECRFMIGGGPGERRPEWFARGATQCYWDLKRPGQTRFSAPMPITCNGKTKWMGGAGGPIATRGRYTVRFWAKGAGGTCKKVERGFTQP